MQALTLPASRGWRWLYEGFMILRKNQLMLTFIVIAYWMLMALVNSIPLIGQIAATVCIPVLSVSLMNACRMIEQGTPLKPQVLFSGFNENLRALLVLGALYLVIALGILGLTVLIDDGALFHLFVTGRQPDAGAGGDVMLAAQVALVLFAPLVMAYWYAPVLVAWHGLPAGKSLFFSFVACARNWRAFLTYSAVILVFVALIPGLALGVMSSFFSDAKPFSIVLTMLIVFIVVPSLYASFYVSYRDVFVRIDEDA